MSRPDVLLHICCAPCLAKTRTGLAAAGGDPARVHGYFFNPNIHPLIEFRRRVKALAVYRTRDPLPCAVDGRYGLADFLARLGAPPPPGDGDAPSPLAGHPPRGAADARFPPPFARPERCRHCYAARFERTARAAAAGGFAAFMTTLQASREQDHDAIRAAGERAARAAGVRFLYHDCRDAEPPPALPRGLYRQSYCGCVFSEADRYAGTRLHGLPEGDGPGADHEASS